jgi:hypothetical protein
MQTLPNEHQEIKIPVYALVVAILIFLLLVGMVNTQINLDGRPLLLLPDVWQTIGYKNKALIWKQEFTNLDRDLNGLISTNPVGDLFTQSRSAQNALERAANLAREIDQSPAPMTASGLRDLLSSTAANYLEASRSTLQWLNIPNDENRNKALGNLQIAQNARQDLEESEWIKMR